MAETTYFDRFFDEKDLPYVMFEIQMEDGLHLIDTDVVIALIKESRANEQKHIRSTLVKLDFLNANIIEYLRFLAKCFLRTQAAA